MTILHVVADLKLASGGPVTALLGLVRAQRLLGLDVMVACRKSRETPQLTAQIRAAGASVHELRSERWAGQSDPALRRALGVLAGRADIVHLHGVWENIHAEASIAARAARTPTIFRTCGMLDRYQLRQKPLKKWIYLRFRLGRELGFARAIHYSTSQERDLTHAPLGLRPPALVEPNGLTLAEFKQRPRCGALRAHFPSIGARPIVLFLGRLHPKKGLPLLLQAFAQLQPMEAALVILGGGAASYEAHLKKLSQRLPGASQVFWGGLWSREASLRALADADLFVLPSYQENFGNAVVEAMAMGVPVVVSREVALWPEVEAAGGGSVCQTDAPDLTAHLKRWLSNDAGRQAAGENARHYALQRFDWNLIAARWNEHYDRILSE